MLWGSPMSTPKMLGQGEQNLARLPRSISRGARHDPTPVTRIFRGLQSSKHFTPQNHRRSLLSRVVHPCLQHLPSLAGAGAALLTWLDRDDKRSKFFLAFSQFVTQLQTVVTFASLADQERTITLVLCRQGELKYCD